jgi:hypothetical protein
LENPSNIVCLGVKGGGDQAQWGKIGKNNAWYISEEFLLRNAIVKNPTRMSEASSRGCWAHWYKLAQSGQEFTFQTVEPYQEDDNEEEDEPEKEVQQPGETDGDQEGDDAAAGGQLPKKPSNKPPGDPASDEPPSDVPPSDKPSDDDPDERHTPNKCLSDRQKLHFLRTSIPENNEPYHEALEIIAAMSVSSYSSLVCISLVN